MTTVVFGEPGYLSLLIAPAVLAAVWVWRFWRRQIELRRLDRARMIPARQRFRMAGDLAFWLGALVASALLIIAVARPRLPSATPQRGGIDVIVLQDGSASMRVADAGGERWRRSMDFLRRLGDALSWRDDRIAMTVFAHIATPQIRLTRDPNTFFFFLDHLGDRPPFRLEDDTTWDTNLELGIAWGLRAIDKDDELHGRSSNARVFVLLSDGEAWSGEVAKALAQVAGRRIPVFVVGVGTVAGGPLPIVKAEDGTPLAIDGPLVSKLDRPALQRIAAAGGGEYFELTRDGDRHIAQAIVTAGRRLAPVVAVEDRGADLYWWALCAASIVGAVAVLFVRHRVELWIVASGVAASAIVATRIIW